MKDIPAFPVQSIYVEDQDTNSRGMTLRDYFAAKAMLVMMPSVMTELQRKSYSVEKAHELKTVSAEVCYAIADAMMKARDL
jgi:hypothetical protein